MFTKRRTFIFLSLIPALILCLSVQGQEKGFVPLFNGKNLDGWVNVNCAKGTFTVKKGMIYCNGKPNGFMRTSKQYEDFILELDWKHVKPKGNSGLFVFAEGQPAKKRAYPKSIEIQIMVGVEKKDKQGRQLYTSQGDVFAIQGATMTPDRPHPAGGGWAMRCLPSENRTKPAGQWNHYRVTCKDGKLKLAINGKVVSGGSMCNPSKGYICLESEGAPIWFKNIRIKELK